MSSRSRVFAAWFLVGLGAPPALYGLGTLSGSLGIPAVGSSIELLALGSCPFWLFLWLPAMSQPDNYVLFYSSVVAVLVANGCLYLLMAQLQLKTRGWRLPLRIATLLIAFPLLMGLGYCLPLGLEAL